MAEEENREGFLRGRVKRITGTIQDALSWLKIKKPRTGG